MERQEQVAHHILVVEDDAVMRDSIAELLEEEGYTVAVANGGEQGLAYLQQSPRPSLILLDLMMPAMNGWEFHSQLQRDPSLATIPVVILSAVADFQRRRGKLDVAAILPKPVNISHLLDVITQTLADSPEVDDAAA